MFSYISQASIAKKLSVYCSWIFSTVLLLIGIWVYYQFQSSMHDSAKLRAREMLQTVSAEIHDKQEQATSLASLVAAMPEVQKAMAERNRDYLKTNFIPSFELLKQKYGVKQFQFHLPPAESFFRVHKAQKYGDDLSSFRHTVVAANKDRKIVSGVEKGVAGIGIRGIAPISHGGKHQGTVEFGMSLDEQFVKLLHENYQHHFAVYLFDGTYKLFASSSEKLAKQHTERFSLDEFVSFSIEHKGGYYQLSSQPLHDFQGKAIGVTVMLQDQNEFVAMLNRSMWALAVFAVIAALISLVLIALVITKVAGRIQEAAKAMHLITHENGDLSEQIPCMGKDELGRLGNSYNEMMTMISTRVVDISYELSKLSTVQSQSHDLADESAHSILTQQDHIAMAATAVEEMSATSQEVANSVAQTAQATHVAKTETEQGCKVLTEVLSDIQKVSDNVSLVSEAVEKTSQESNAVAEVVSVINGIAEQTNLLALNAAIEAARAGEQGRGFAVVADEVRNLASRTQESTAEIQKMINALQEGVQSAVEIINDNKELAKGTSENAGKAFEALNTIGGSISEINSMADQIAAAAEQQSITAEDTNQKVVSIKELADTTHGHSQRLVDKSEEVEATIASLIQETKKFNVSAALGLELATTKSAHLAWRSRVRGLARDSESIDESVLVDHTQCILGKWYYSVGKDILGNDDLFRAIEPPHIKIHQRVKDAVKAIKAGNSAEYQKAYEDVMQLSEEIVELIELMEKHAQENFKAQVLEC